MSSFKYNKIPLSIQETPCSYVTSIDDYKTMAHIMDVIVNEKITNEYLSGIFRNIKKIFNGTIDALSRSMKDSRNIDQSKLEKHIKSGNRFIILTNNEQYPSFASYPKGYEEDIEKLVFSVPPSVLYNVGMLENTGSVSVVPSNANVFLSSLIYAYALMCSSKMYMKLNQDILLNISKIYYTLLLTAFGRRSGLMVGSRESKEYLFFLSCCLSYGLYVPKNKAMMNLKDYLAYCASNSGSVHLNQFLHKYINNSSLTKKDNPWDPSNCDNLLKLSNLARTMDLLQASESEIKVQWFKTLGSYGVMALENYPRFVAYIASTVIPNAYITTTVKQYNKPAYEYLVEYYIKELYSIG